MPEPRPSRNLHIHRQKWLSSPVEIRLHTNTRYEHESLWIVVDRRYLRFTAAAIVNREKKRKWWSDRHPNNTTTHNLARLANKACFRSCSLYVFLLFARKHWENERKNGCSVFSSTVEFPTLSALARWMSRHLMKRIKHGWWTTAEYLLR